MEDGTDHEDWRAWFDRHGPRLLLCARQWTRTASDAEDVVQEAFVRYWKHQRGLGGEPLPLLLTSIRRAATDLARSRARRERRENHCVDGEADGDSWFEPAVGPDGRRDALECALRELPVEQREVVALRLWGQLSFDEIGRQLSVSPNTAASRYRYALDALRKRMEGGEA